MSAPTVLTTRRGAVVAVHGRLVLSRRERPLGARTPPADPLDRAALRRACPLLVAARTLQEEPDTLTVVADKDGAPVKLSFFGGIDFGRVGDPVRVPERPPIASRLDLLGTKLATVTQRVEARDYLDIAALLASGLTINDGVAALLALYRNQASGLQSVKTIVWFQDGGLDGAAGEAGGAAGRLGAVWEADPPLSPRVTRPADGRSSGRTPRGTRSRRPRPSCPR